MATPRPSKTSLILAHLGTLAFVGSTMLLSFLALDIIYLPYLSPLAHLVALLISPFIPLLFPAFLGVFLKVCRRATWPKKKFWVFMTGSSVFQHTGRAVADALALWHHGEGCGLAECRGRWLEWVLVVWVVAAQSAGWRWDLGYVDAWIDHLVDQEAEKWARAEADGGAQGELEHGPDLEKGTERLEKVVCRAAQEDKQQLAALGAEEEVLVLVVSEDMA
ncbi:uncharacterized protein L3040_008682 [Drepanopeziza brunnea f. sp. 'multigermtubi']|uniref:uncharacterized protein n=1 Tax=Drepanopeziza brunnea f. sp. 'multigermtubi' TaxID=698441 RepID=UPI0023890CA7|nr:hypothetical protein L3040_008682 [Drepanopeziza brunnea f. sp. 'multigermtubi']